MPQNVDLAETGQPMFITVAGREIVVMDAEPFRAMQDKAEGVDDALRYAASVLHDLSEANAEINRLRDVVVTYGDKVRMANCHSMEWQQAIDRAFDRE